MTEFTNLQIALGYAKQGLAVFPCHTIRNGKCSCGREDCGSAGKHPLTVNGVKDASRFAGTITAWFNKSPDANIAIACGKASMGLVVIDVDPQHGGNESFDLLIEDHGKFPDTPMVLTGGSGRHLYFRSEETIQNKVGLYPGIDVRGENGYVVAPLSRHLSGKTYEWEGAQGPKSIPIAPLPPWIADALKRGQGNASVVDRVDPMDVFAGLPEGARNDGLYRYACSLRARQSATQVEALELLRVAFGKCNPPYTDEDPEVMLARVWEAYPAGNSTQREAVEPSGMVAEILEEEPSAPIITTEDRCVKVEWVSKGIVAIAKRLKEHTDGQIAGNLEVISTIPGMSKSLRSAQFRFSSIPSRNELAKDLGVRAPDLPWSNMIELLCKAVANYVEAGEPTQTIDPNAAVTPAEYVVWPLVLYKHPTILFGDPGTTKSYIGAFLTYLVALGEQRTILDLEVRKHLANPLYLDWEGDVDSLAARLASLRVGMELPPVHIAYRRCTRSLAADLDRIKSEITARGSEFVVIDSLGPACGSSSLMDPESANEFFAALRTLNVSSLILGHNAKNSGSGPRSVFGSMFFGALARSIWEARREDDEDADSVEVGLFHKKMNYGRRERPIGLQFHFGEGATMVSAHSPKDIAAASGMLPLTQRILRALKDTGKMSVGELAEQLGAPQETVRVTLYKLRDKRPPLVERFDKSRWAAMTEAGVKEEMPWDRY